MASIMKNQAVSFAVKSIRQRLMQSPHAIDTVEGIHFFWIEWREPFPPTVVTQAALELLEQEGFVDRVLVDSRELWKKNKLVP